MYRYLFIDRRARRGACGRARRPRLRARATRCRRGAIGRVATALFLRTYERGERVHLAMLARGYNGAHAAPADALALGRADAAFLCAVAARCSRLRVALAVAA